MGWFRYFLFGCLGVLLCAATINADSETVVSEMDLLDDTRKLSVGDRLVYEVVEEGESARVLFVNDRGELDVPLIGTVVAVSKTCRALAVEVKKELEKDYFYRATVLINFQYGDGVRGRVTLVGQVRQQGPQGIPSDDILTVSNVILRAGGFLPDAERNRVTLIRKNPDSPDSETQQVIDVDKILQTGNLSLDIVVQPEDLIVVPKRAQAGGQIYIIGAVGAPGLYDLPMEKDFTLTKAILRAGGFNKFANRKKVKLIRGDKSLPEKERTIFVNVSDILDKGELDKDPVVKSDDIIRVEESWINF
jgi:protein involved in polysaccharide export with SLBB domain